MTWLGHSLQTITPLQVCILLFASLVGAIWDLKSRRIPNWLTFPMLITGLVWSAYARGPSALPGALAAATILALPYLLLFMYAGGGGGDVKLMAAIGAWSGLAAGVLILFLVALCGVIMGVIWASANGQLRATLRRVGGLTSQAIPAATGHISTSHLIRFETAQMQPMPYGIAILAGVCMAMGGVLLWKV